MSAAQNTLTTGIKRSSVVWFDDGNVILQAHDTQFRVYRGTLINESSVFCDMFSLPQPASSKLGSEVHGCPLVVLPDAADEVGLSLKAIVDRTFFRPGSTQDGDTIFAILRFATKYLIKSLRADALTFLIPPLCPKDYADLCEWEDKFGQLVEYNGSARVADVLYECNVPAALPLLFFITLTVKVLRSSDEMKEDKTSRGSQALTFERDFTSAADDLQCMTALYSLVDRYMTTSHNLFASHKVPLCTDPKTCRMFWGDNSKMLLKNFSALGWDALYPTTAKSTTGLQGKTLICTACDTVRADCYVALCEENFHSLPRIFGVGKSWQELFDQTYADDEASVN